MVLKLPSLREIRESRGLSQSELAREAHVSRDSISNYETGQREAWPATAKRLAEALGVEITDLRRTEEPAFTGEAEAPEQGQQGATGRITAVLPTGRGPNVTREMLADLGIEATDTELNALNIHLEGRARQRVEGGPTAIATLASDNVDNEKVMGWVDAVEDAFPDWIARKRFKLASGNEATQFETLVDITLERIKRAALEGRRALDDIGASDASAGIDPELHVAYEGLINESLNLVEEFDAEHKRV